MGNYSIVLQVETWLIFVERPVYLIKLEIGSLAQSIESPWSYQLLKTEWNTLKVLFLKIKIIITTFANLSKRSQGKIVRSSCITGNLLTFDNLTFDQNDKK